MRRSSDGARIWAAPQERTSSSQPSSCRPSARCPRPAAALRTPLHDPLAALVYSSPRARGSWPPSARGRARVSPGPALPKDLRSLRGRDDRPASAEIRGDMVGQQLGHLLGVADPAERSGHSASAASSTLPLRSSRSLSDENAAVAMETVKRDAARKCDAGPRRRRSAGSPRGTRSHPPRDPGVVRQEEKPMPQHHLEPVRQERSSVTATAWM